MCGVPNLCSTSYQLGKKGGLVMLKYFVLLLGVFAYFVGATSEGVNSFIIGAGLGTILIAQSLVLYYFELRKKAGK